MSLSDDDRAAKEQSLRDVAQELRDLSNTPGATGNETSINEFAAQAERYADQIRDATTPEAAEAVAEEATRKRGQWSDLVGMLDLANNIEGSEREALQEAEAKLRKTAEGLRAVSRQGATSVFGQIGAVADQAEAGLVEFLAAGSTQEKWEVYARVENNRNQWLHQMQDLHSNMSDGNESQAPTEAPDPSDPAFEDCAEDEDFQDATGCKVLTEIPARAATGGGAGAAVSSAAMRQLLTDFDIDGGFCTPVAPSGVSSTRPAANGGYSSNDVPVTAASSSSNTAVAAATATAAPSPMEAAIAKMEKAMANGEEVSFTPEEARQQVVLALSDEEEGLLVTLRRAVAKVKEDDRFEGVYEDAGQLLEQMELAAGAVLPSSLVQEEEAAEGGELADAEERMKATVEPMRKAQWGAQRAKTAAFKVQKYDIYIAKGKKPKLADEHPELLECVKVSIELSSFLRKEAQGAILDSVTGLVAALPR